MGSRNVIKKPAVGIHICLFLYHLKTWIIFGVFLPVTWLLIQNMLFGPKSFIHCAWNSGKNNGMSFFIFSVVSRAFKKLYWPFYWIMYQSGFPVQSSRNLLRRGHNRIPEINAEHFVSKLVSVILEHILRKGDDLIRLRHR